MKKIVFFGIILFITVKITLYFNKKQSEKLLIEKKKTQFDLKENEKEDISKAMHKFESLKARMREELNRNKHIISSTPSPVNNEENEIRPYNEYEDYFKDEEQDDEKIDDDIEEKEDKQVSQDIENIIEGYEGIDTENEDLEYYQDPNIEDNLENEDIEEIRERKAIKTIRSIKSILKDNRNNKNTIIEGR